MGRAWYREPMRASVGLGVLVFFGCTSAGDAPDGGPEDGGADATPSDAGPDGGPGDTGPVDQGPGPDGPPPLSACPPAADAVFDPAAPYPVTVTAAARYCAYGSGGSLEDTFRQAAILRFVPGAYRFPTTPGASALRLPVCMATSGGGGATLGASGTLTLTRESLIGETLLTYRLEQPLVVNGADRLLRMSAYVWEFSSRGEPPVPLVLDDALRHGNFPDTEVGLELCEPNGCANAASIYFPCAGDEGLERTTHIVFDRGELFGTIRIAAGSAGPSAPAIATRIRGTLDGVSFDVEDYFRLAHRPDHHNRGGGFLVRFAAPIGGAHFLKAVIPSEDGSFWVDQPSAALLDADLAELEVLTGVRPGD